jgi:hypothetical protein
MHIENPGNFPGLVDETGAYKPVVDLLKGDYVRSGAEDDFRNALRGGLAVHPDAAVDVVGHDPYLLGHG